MLIPKWASSSFWFTDKENVSNRRLVQGHTVSDSSGRKPRLSGFKAVFLLSSTALRTFQQKKSLNITIKRNEILTFATTWMDLESVTLNEINQTKTNTI